MAATGDHYDAIVIGSGPGGASLAHRLARRRQAHPDAGARRLPAALAPATGNPKTVFVDATYQTKETWYNRRRQTPSIPASTILLAATPKSMEAALLRLRERDFGKLRHKDGISPAWPLGYDVFEPYYTQAEALYHVHGQRGEDPTEPWSSAPYAYPPVKHEPRIQGLNDILAR